MRATLLAVLLLACGCSAPAPAPPPAPPPPAPIEEPGQDDPDDPPPPGDAVAGGRWPAGDDWFEQMSARKGVGPMSARVLEYAASHGAEAVVISAAIEAELAQLDPPERAEFLRDLGLEEPGLHRVIRAAYRLLGLKTFFTAGPKEVRAWTVASGALAPQAAGAIHTDFERGFIRAEVIGYDDYVRLQGEQGAREAGA